MQGRLGTLAAALAAATTFAVGVAAAPAGAALRWSAPETLSPGFPGTVAIDARGDVLAVWQRYFGGTDVRTYYAWRAPGGGWTEARQLPGAGARFALALTPLGRATAVWNDGGRIVSQDARPGGAFGGLELVASGVAPGAGVALASDDVGNAVAAWSVDTRSTRRNAGNTIFAATRPFGGRWSEPEAVSGDVAGGGPFVAVNAAGAAAVAWTTAENGYAELAYRQPAGAFGPPERAPLTGPAFPLWLAVDDDGRAVLGSASQILTNNPIRTQMATRSPLGGWSERFEFETGGSPETMLGEPDGSVTFLMNDANDREHPRVQFATRTRDGSVIGPETLATDRGSIEGAMNLRGDILAAWHQSPGIGRVEVSERAHGGRFAAPVAVSGPSAVEPEVALNDAGQAAVVWATDYASPQFQIAVREDPALPPLPFPPGVEVEVPAVPALDGDGDLVVPVACTSACEARPEAILAPGGGAKLRAAAGPARRLKARRRATLKVDFGSAGARAVRKALRARRKPVVYVSVRARGASPRPLTASRRIRLR